MGEFEFVGAAALKLLERAMTNSAARLQAGLRRVHIDVHA